MFSRFVTEEIFERLSYNPGVVLLGSRQVGKSTLAQGIASKHPNALFLDLERPVDRAKLANPSAFFAAHRARLVVLDEVQTMPDMFSVLRPEIDAARHAGRFLLLGSASGTLLRQSAESLAGRVSYIELPTLMDYEVFDPSIQPATDLNDLLSFGCVVDFRKAI
jgi:predicted AAA+ superfamily ATPase